MDSPEFHAFDPNAEYSVVLRWLPHWAQAGTMCFITWRTADSMPREVVECWIAERNELLSREGIDVDHSGFSETRVQLSFRSRLTIRGFLPPKQ